jgi:hypothetical protein
MQGCSKIALLLFTTTMKIQTNLFFFDENVLKHTEKHHTWEDAYIALLHYAETNKLEIQSNSAVSANKKQVIQIIQKFL